MWRGVLRFVVVFLQLMHAVHGFFIVLVGVMLGALLGAAAMVWVFSSTPAMPSGALLGGAVGFWFGRRLAKFEQLEISLKHWRERLERPINERSQDS